MKNGTNTTEFVYGNFEDWNNPLFKIEALYAGTIVERRNGTVVRDLKTKVTEIGQVYVVVPVPDSVQKAAEVRSEDCDEGDHAGNRSRRPCRAGPRQWQRNSALLPRRRIRTRRRPSWPTESLTCQAPGRGPAAVSKGSGGDMFRRCTPFQSKNCMEWTNQSEDWVFMSATRLDQRQPLYKPEHWDKIIELDQWTNKYDPVMTCLPLGIPRQGPPARIFQTENDITMIYRGGVDGGGGYAEFRMIPVDGKPHDPRRAAPVHVHGVHGRPLGRRHAGPRLHRVLR